MKLDATTATCLVFTFKDGLLSRLAHDLQIRVTAFELSIESDENGVPASIEAEFRADSLRVDFALRDGREDRTALGRDDLAKIEQNIRDDVLHSNRFAEVRFVSTEIVGEGSGFGVAGTLSLHGRSKTVRVRAQRDGDDLVAELALHQPDFGITPYKAMMGTLKVKPTVRVRLTVPWEAGSGSGSGSGSG